MGVMGGMPVSITVMDFRFMAASLGSAAGEKITRAIERGIEKSCPVIIVSASGGARMQEGILSLMQLAKTSATGKVERGRATLLLDFDESDYGWRHGKLCIIRRCNYR